LSIKIVALITRPGSFLAIVQRVGSFRNTVG
jgi:hypothetical protein